MPLDPILDEIAERETEWTHLRGRQDIDRDLYWLKEYKMRGLDNEEIPEIVNVTLNKARNDAFRVVSSISGARQQIVIEGEDLTDEERTGIEEGLGALFIAIDELLPRRDIPSLAWFESEQLAMRGGIGVRTALRMSVKDPTKFIPDILPMDFRTLTTEYDLEGIKYHAYTTQRTYNDVLRDYGEEVAEKRINFKTRAIECVDHWTPYQNTIFLDGQKVLEQENTYGEDVCTFQPSVISTTFRDEDFWAHWAESIFHSTRNLYPEANRQMSIFQTMTVAQFLGAMQKEVTGPGQKPTLPPWTLRGVIPYMKGTKPYEPLPVNDIRGASRLGHAILDNSIQQGLLPSIDYGTLNFPLSAVAISTLTSARDLIFVPLLQGKSLFRRRLCQVMIGQIIKKNLTLNLSLGNKKVKITPATFDGDYTISFRYVAANKEQDIANVAAANALGDQVSQRYKLENVLQLESPEIEEQRIRAERAEQMDPVMMQFNFVISLIEQKKQPQALIAWKKLQEMVLMPPMPEQAGGQMAQAGGAASPQPLIPLMGTGSGGRGKRSPDTTPSLAGEQSQREDE